MEKTPKLKPLSPALKTPLKFLKPLSPALKTPLKSLKPLSPALKTPLKSLKPLSPAPKTPLKPLSPAPKTPLSHAPKTISTPKLTPKLLELKTKEQIVFMGDVDNWFGNGGYKEDIILQFKLDDPDHDYLNKLRKEIVSKGGKVTSEKDLPEEALKAFLFIQDYRKSHKDEEFDYDTFYPKIAKLFYS